MSCFASKTVSKGAPVERALAVIFLFTRVCALGAGVPAQETASPQAQQLSTSPTIRVNVNVVNVGVTVTDASGKFVGGLRSEDFRLFDNGVEQPLTGFLSIEEPAQIVLMMECGPAALFIKQSEQDAAERLIAKLSAADRLAIVTYSQKPDLLMNFTSNKTQAQLVVQSINYLSGFTELNLAYSVGAVLDWLATTPGKKTVVLLSSGVDTSSEKDWQATLQKITASDVRILAASVTGDLRSPPKGVEVSAEEKEQRRYVEGEFGKADKVLQVLASATGGRVYLPKTKKEAAKAYAEMAEYASHEYSLGFAPAQDGRTHEIRVQLKRGSLRVAHRQAYVAPGAE